MEQIVVQVSNKEKAKILLELLTSLDFVNSVKTDTLEGVEASFKDGTEVIDFFSLAGLWQDREVSLETIRQKAWPKQQ